MRFEPSVADKCTVSWAGWVHVQFGERRERAHHIRTKCGEEVVVEMPAAEVESERVYRQLEIEKHSGKTDDHTEGYTEHLLKSVTSRRLPRV